MQDILFECKMHPSTWAYLSSLLIIGIFFKFRRFWSLRNLDLVGLIAFTPGLLLITHGREAIGYVWIFSVMGFFLVRLLLDPVMVRRPLLEPNLSPDGLTFTGAALLVFLTTNIVAQPLTPAALGGARRLEEIIAPSDPASDAAETDYRGPGYPPFYRWAHLSQREVPSGAASPQGSWVRARQVAWAQAAAILGYLALVLGIVAVGLLHFVSFTGGMAAATLYLLMPYAAEMSGHIEHVVPAALLVWTVVAYRRPLVAGLLLGLAGGLIYYPLYLLPLWCGFYFRRGLLRFALGVAVSLGILVVALALTGRPALGAGLQQMFGLFIASAQDMRGFWQYHESAYRIPVLAAFVALCASMALWPVHKNLGTLLSCSAAVMIGVQFWRAHYGGLTMAWYLPLTLLTILRPNLEDRIAVSAVRELWIWPRRREPARLPAAPSPASP